MTRRVRGALVLALASGCASAVPPPVARPSPTSESPRAPASEPADLSPVAEPPGLLLVARVRPHLLAEPALGFDEPGTRLAPELSDALGQLIAAEPLELAVAGAAPEAILLRGVDVAWSLPLTSWRAASDALRTLPRVGVERVRPGVVNLSLEGGPQCVLAASLGTSPARLVCAHRRATVDALAPYLARGLPTRELGGAPAVLEAWPSRFARPHRQALRQAARFLTPRTGRGLDSALAVLVDDAVDALADVDHARVVVHEKGGGLELEVRLDVGEQSSWLARTLALLPSRSAGLGELWSRLPADTQAAWFFTAAAPARSDEARSALVGWLAEEAGPRIPRSALELVARTFIQKVPYLHAHGDAHGRDAFAGYVTGRALWETTRSSYGWHVFGFDEPLPAYLVELDRGMRAYNQGPLRDLAYRALPRLCAGLGKIRKKPAPRSLPAGSWVYELPLPGKLFDACVAGRAAKPAPAPDDSLVVIAVPLGERSMIGLGLGEREMSERMRQVLLPRADGPSLDSSAARLGGFTSLAGIAGLLRFAGMREHRKWSRMRLDALPNHGATRASFWLETARERPGRALIKLELPPGFVADLQATKDPSLRKRW